MAEQVRLVPVADANPEDYVRGVKTIPGPYHGLVLVRAATEGAGVQSPDDAASAAEAVSTTTLQPDQEIA